ncbi:bifunctional methylenetetrahydrofolate dehydrogenase/methenyltetrahydrofolate cyclohydrolase [Fructilactobacillus lindneri]|uniref:bifunctional 5,10-methylenetetrahydrofolate dehydrogenase/5,10-methenyltetrahydrofolate cyclohydrolase n=1 Tax=Fructilactobacillus lindneri TaxID=53444 RepID=UPI000CD46672|nr:tetrahydrofolate dehydrogenase/cyclohydrolase catalytic domain-containing protein [Fructilactobacillus lindneri]POH08780.1 bifunctional methylenetetrahydrofolate dehydrogenase/methenyltetrahydrofolate cyclohydrolase [Fructilactobacillus lindneri]
MVEIIDGKKEAKHLNEITKQHIEKLAKSGIVPGIAVIIVGHDQASERYVRMKDKKARSLGIYSIMKHFENDISETDLIKSINELNHDPKINGILVQLPLPSHINEQNIIQSIDPKKDVDGFHPLNIGKLFLNLNEQFPVACTPKGIMTLLAAYQVNLNGANVVVIGRSPIVGKPLLALLLNANASLTCLHSHSENITLHTKKADLVISAVGNANTLNDNHFKPGAYVIDAGQNLDINGKLVGDVSYDQNSKNIGFITPVPGGVGPMTIATLMQQTVEMCEWSHVE